VNTQPVALTLKEFQLLCLLFEKDGAVVERDEILRSIWGYTYDGESRTVDVHIRNLRQKLGDAGACIETVKGLGYKIGGHA
ncbi:MAG: winged helix-turn-helix transcriptional regulator, partial [Clostridia bacterium]|nr:winged helix-turn-helix transcriptional regulator [Clostridia bacterium]